MFASRRVSRTPFTLVEADASPRPDGRASYRCVMLVHSDVRSDTEVNDGSLGGMASLSSRRAVLLHTLDTVDALVDVCGDFLSSKVAEDLWPLLRVSVRALTDRCCASLCCAVCVGVFLVRV